MMVVIEVALEKTEFTHPESGAYHEHNQSYQCLCVWYSAKHCAFEQNWFPCKVLRAVEGCNQIKRLSPDKGKWKIGDTVTLVTSSCEAEKIQVSKKWRDGKEAEHGDFRAALAHVCPPLTIIGSCASKASEPLIDSKTGKTKRWRASRFVKVKYYNEKEDKFSEHQLPESALAKLNPVPQALLQELIQLIENGSFVWIRGSEGKDLVSIGVPKAINYVAGQYFLLVKCYLYNKMETINASAIYQVHALERSWETNSEGGRRGYLSVLPDFKEVEIPSQEGEREEKNKKVVITHSHKANEIKTLCETYKHHPFRIIYKSYDDKIAQRTILPLEIFSSDETIPFKRDGDTTEKLGDEEKEVKMIRAYCCNSQLAELYFSTGRIMQLQVLPVIASKNKEENNIIVSDHKLDWKVIWPQGE